MTPREKYRVVRKIDSGGMAEVFLGEAESLEGFKKRVAIKRVLPHLVENRKFLAMFLDEARLSLRFNNANVVQTFDIGRSENTYFVVMEYVDGVNLKRIVERLKEKGERLTVELAVFIAIEICRGLSYAHNFKSASGEHLGIVHRDVSPPNILMSKQGEVKIVDFGLAKATSQLENTDPGVVKGKFAYLSPEAARGESVDLRADLFACGIILFEMLTGERLFLGKNDVKTVEKVRAAEVPSLQKLNPDVPPALEAILRKSLAKDPADRFQGCNELAESLAGFLFEFGRRVTSFDLQRLVSKIASEEEHREVSKPSIIDQLIQEEIGRFSSLGEDGEPSPEISGRESDGGAAPLDPMGFEDPRDWVGEMGVNGHNTPINEGSGNNKWLETARSINETGEMPAPSVALRPPSTPDNLNDSQSLVQMLEGEVRMGSSPPPSDDSMKNTIVAIAVGGTIALIVGIVAFIMGWVP